MNRSRQNPGSRQTLRSTQLGVGLVEILVAVLVLSIGLLGMAQLQIKSLATNNSAMFRSLATMYSYSVIDAMRVDVKNLSAYETTVTADDCPAAGGSLASRQLNQWCVSLKDSIRDAASTTGQIDCNTTKVCTVTITFDDSKAGVGGSSTQKIITKVAL